MSRRREGSGILYGCDREIEVLCVVGEGWNMGILNMEYGMCGCVGEKEQGKRLYLRR
jgi:hypothetical protein